MMANNKSEVYLLAKGHIHTCIHTYILGSKAYSNDKYN